MRCLLRLTCLLLLFPFVLHAEETSQLNYLRRAHAHNDYYHERPLIDALEHGFCSVEADIFLKEGKLLVGHSENELSPTRTLSALYLDPLKKVVQKNGGRVFKDYPYFTLLVDVKSDAVSTFQVLHQVLAQYQDILTTVQDDKVKHNAVRVVVSGNRAWEEIAATNPRYCSIDGRLSDVNSDLPAHLLSMISDNWRNHFKWRGEGNFSQVPKERLKRVVRQVHQAGRAIRFWNTPENPKLWQELYAAGVDHINTDQLGNLSQFLNEENRKANQFFPEYDSHIPLPEIRIEDSSASIHTQGLLLTPKFYYVTGRLNSTPRRALLLRISRNDPEQYEYLDITPGAEITKRNQGILDHPGGFDSDGKNLWIPISASRRNSLSVIVKVPLNEEQPLNMHQPETMFEVDDHIGALAIDAVKKLLYGANWDTLITYRWSTSGEQQKAIPQNQLIKHDPGQKIAVQDWKSRGDGILMMSGKNRRKDSSPLSSYAILETVQMKNNNRLGQGEIFSPVIYDGTITHEGFAIEGDYLYFLPHDLGEKANIYRYRWSNPVK